MPSKCLRFQVKQLAIYGRSSCCFLNAISSAIQHRNRERIWEKPVLDRVALIIEIYNAYAHTKKAKIQAELATLMYKRSKLVRVRGPDGRQTVGHFGEAEVVSARGRAASKGLWCTALEKENGPRTVKEVKLISAGKVLENNKTVKDYRSPVSNLVGGVTTMHVIIQPPVTEKEKKPKGGWNKCACAVM